MGKKQNWFIIGGFLVMIFGVAGVNFLKPAREFSERENRSLEQKPEFSLGAYFAGTFAADYESYITDQFIARDGWIGVKTKVERATGKQEINDIYYADDGYLIEKHTGSFTGDTAKKNISHLSQFMEMAVQRYGEAHVRTLIAPNAVNVLKDKLPPFAAPFDENVYLGEIAAALPEGTWIDSASKLNEHKDEYLYYKTDHHWTTLAAFYAYETWIDSIGLAPPQLSDYHIETASNEFLGTIEAKVGGETEKDTLQLFKAKDAAAYTVEYNENGEQQSDLYHMDALATKDKYTVFFGGNQPIVQAKIANDSQRKLLVIKDSYAHCFIPFTFRDFSEVTFIDLRYYNKSLKENLDKNDYTDILFLYNASGFAEDPNVARLLN